MKNKEKKRVAVEAAKKEEEKRKRNEEVEIKKRQGESEGLRLTRSKKDQQTADPIDTQGEHDHTDQGNGQDNTDSQEPTTTSGSTQEKKVFSQMNLIPFMQKEGEEIPDFNTIFYEKALEEI